MHFLRKTKSNFRLEIYNYNNTEFHVRVVTDVWELVIILSVVSALKSDSALKLASGFKLL